MLYVIIYGKNLKNVSEGGFSLGEVKKLFPQTVKKYLNYLYGPDTFKKYVNMQG